MPFLLLCLVVLFLIGSIWTLRVLAGSRRTHVRDIARAQTAVIIIVAVFLPLAVWHVADIFSVIPKISRMVVPYPNGDDPTSDDALAFGILFAARDSNPGQALRRKIDSLKASHAYLLHTTDSPETVARFYHDPSHYAGWTVVADDTLFIFLHRGAERLMIGARDEGFGRGTRIIYFWQKD
jgi:hypothetical protein